MVHYYFSDEETELSIIEPNRNFCNKTPISLLTAHDGNTQEPLKFAAFTFPLSQPCEYGWILYLNVTKNTAVPPACLFMHSLKPLWDECEITYNSAVLDYWDDYGIFNVVSIPEQQTGWIRIGIYPTQVKSGYLSFIMWLGTLATQKDIKQKPSGKIIKNQVIGIPGDGEFCFIPHSSVTKNISEVEITAKRFGMKYPLPIKTTISGLTNDTESGMKEWRKLDGYPQLSKANPQSYQLTAGFYKPEYKIEVERDFKIIPHFIPHGEAEITCLNEKKSVKIEMKRR